MSASEFAIKAAQNESLWRERLARQAASGKTIAAFCREEGVGKSTMSYWRKRLGVVGPQTTAVRAPFLDVGSVRSANESPGRIELRLELGDGVVLHIAKH
jgi:transposase-like protein